MFGGQFLLQIPSINRNEKKSGWFTGCRTSTFSQFSSACRCINTLISTVVRGSLFNLFGCKSVWGCSDPVSIFDYLCRYRFCCRVHITTLPLIDLVFHLNLSEWAAKLPAHISCVSLCFPQTPPCWWEAAVTLPSAPSQLRPNPPTMRTPPWW